MKILSNSAMKPFFVVILNFFSNLNQGKDQHQKLIKKRICYHHATEKEERQEEEGSGTHH
jgi:hypothetical protein